MLATPSLRPAGNGRARVNVVSWSKTSEIAQLSNFAAARMILRFSAEELRLLGLKEEDIAEFCPQNVEFEIDCGSVEGFVQALKAAAVEEQLRIARLSGKPAKQAGSAQLPEIREGKRLCFFLTTSFLYTSAVHRALIEYAIVQKFQQDEDSRVAMEWSGDAELTHNLGKFDAKPGKTSLPKQVFTRILHDCRRMIRDAAPAPSFGEILAAVKDDVHEELQWY